jgi:hypothetical protein
MIEVVKKAATSAKLAPIGAFVVFLWCSCGVPVVFLWCSCGVPVMLL